MTAGMYPGTTQPAQLITGGTNDDPNSIGFGAEAAGSSNRIYFGYTPSICGQISHGDCIQPGELITDADFPDLTFTTALYWE